MTASHLPQPAREPHIWSSVLRGIKMLVAEHGIDADGLLNANGIVAEDLHNPHGEVPLKKYLEFLEAAAREAKDPLLGIRLACSAGPELLGAVGLLFLSSRTLADAMHHLYRYVSLLQGATHVQLAQNAEEIAFSYQLCQAPDIARRQDVEFSLAFTCRLIQIYSGREVKMTAVNFRHSAAAPKADYQRLLKAPVFFEQEANSITFPAAAGAIQGKILDTDLSDVIKGFLDEEMARNSRTQTFSDQVSRLLMESPAAPQTPAAEVARRLGVSEATFYRRLKTERTSYGAIAAAQNFDLAKIYLSESRLPITQIAHLVGFAESASFTRAFVRWTGGTTPSQFRKSSLRPENLTQGR